LGSRSLGEYVPVTGSEAPVAKSNLTFAQATTTEDSTEVSEEKLADGEAEENAANVTAASRGGGSRRGREAARFYPVTKEPAAPVAAPEDSNLVVRKRKTRHSTNPPVEQHVGWIMDKKAHAQRERLESLSESVGSMASSGGGTPQSLPTFHHPSHSLLKVETFLHFVS
jgi:hypothetical protein